MKGAAYVYAFDNGDWILEDILTGDDSAFGDEFGRSVSLSGDRAAIGAFNSELMGVDAGAVYMFRFNGSTWVQEQKVVSSDLEGGDQFGGEVQVLGNRLAVSAQRDDDRGNASGAVYIFDYDGSNWVESRKLTASDGLVGDEFGEGLALGVDRVAVGANGRNEAFENAGAVYVYDYTGSDWIERDKLVASDQAALDEFGRDVAISGDRLLVGALRADAAGTDSGAAYVFTRNPANSLWTEQQKLVPADLNGSDLFGLGLAIRNDTALIGAFNKELSGAAAAGSAYVFRNQQGTWVEGERLVASNPGAGAQLGFDVALSDFQAFAGAYQGNDGSRSAGVVYEYSFNGLPNAVDDEFNSAEDFPVAGNVLNANPAIPDSDPDGDPIRVANPGVFVAGGIGGDVELTESGALAYQPPADVTGEALFDYQLTDGRGGFSTGTVRINVAPAADLQIDKISNSFFTEPGGTISYTIEIANPGPSDVIGATVDDQLPPRLGNATWECIADPGASCAADGTGDLADEPVDLPEGTSVIFTLDAELLDTENDPITNTASVTAPVGVLELVPANNVDSDTDLVGLFADGMESVEP